MPARFESILDFLTSKAIAKRKAEWLISLEDEIESSVSFDKEIGTISFPAVSETGEVDLDTSTFDDFILDIFNSEIIPKVKSEVRALKYGNDQSVKVYRKSEISEILTRLYSDLKCRADILENSISNIPKTLQSIKEFNLALFSYITQKGEDKGWMNDMYPKDVFKGYRITDEKVKDSSRLLEEISNYLVRNKLIEETGKANFISLFSERWNNKSIEWKGSPKVFYAFYDAFFNPADADSIPLISIKGHKFRIPQLLDCFRVFDDKSKMLLTNKTIKPYNSKPKENATNKALRNIIENNRD